MLQKLEFGKKSAVTLEEKMISGVFYERVFLFFESRREFSFPLKQVSSIRFEKQTNIKFKAVLAGGVWCIVWLIALFFGGIGVVIALIFLGLWAYKLYLTFRPEIGIYITASGGDTQWVPLPATQQKKAKDFVFLANEQIAKL